VRDDTAQAAGEMLGGTACPGPAPSQLQWTVHPARRRPALTVATGVLVVLVLVLVYVSFLQIGAVILSAALLLGSLAPYWAPTRFELTPEGVAVFGPLPVRQWRPWTDFRAFESATNGVLVTPFLRPSRLDNFRGIFLRTEDNRRAVVEFLDTVAELADRARCSAGRREARATD